MILFSWETLKPFSKTWSVHTAVKSLRERLSLQPCEISARLESFSFSFLLSWNKEQYNVQTIYFNICHHKSSYIFEPESWKKKNHANKTASTDDLDSVYAEAAVLGSYVHLRMKWYWFLSVRAHPMSIRAGKFQLGCDKSSNLFKRLDP